MRRGASRVPACQLTLIERDVTIQTCLSEDWDGGRPQEGEPRLAPASFQPVSNPGSFSVLVAVPGARNI